MKKFLTLCCLAALLATGCATRPTRPAAPPQASTATPVPVSTATPKPTLTPTAEPTLTPTPTEALFNVTLAEDASCRLGPGENYFKLATEFNGEVVELLARNAESTWVLVHENANDPTSPTCWFPAAALSNPGPLEKLELAEYELLPPGPTTITATNGVCGNNRPMVITWSPVVEGAEYQLSRDGKVIATQTGGQFSDFKLPAKGKATTVTYSVQGINASGTSPAIAIRVTLCGKQ